MLEYILFPQKYLFLDSQLSDDVRNWWYWPTEGYLAPCPTNVCNRCVVHPRPIEKRAGWSLFMHVELVISLPLPSFRKVKFAQNNECDPASDWPGATNCFTKIDWIDSCGDPPCVVVAPSQSICYCPSNSQACLAPQICIFWKRHCGSFAILPWSVLHMSAHLTYVWTSVVSGPLLCLHPLSSLPGDSDRVLTGDDRC